MAGEKIRGDIKTHELVARSAELCNWSLGTHAVLAGVSGAAAGMLLLSNPMVGAIYASGYFLGRVVHWACIKIMPTLDGKRSDKHWFLEAYRVCALAISFFAATAATWQALAWTKHVLLALQWPIARSLAFRTISLPGAIALNAVTAGIAVGLVFLGIVTHTIYRNYTVEQDPDEVKKKAAQHEQKAAASNV